MNILYDSDDIEISQKWGIDSDLVPLMEKDGIPLPILQLYHAWRRGICEDDSPIPASEHAASIEKVKRLLSEETLATDADLRNQIIESQAQMKKIAQGESQDTELTVDALLKRGQNPGHWLRKLREKISEDLSVQVDDIRRESARSSTDEPPIDLADRDARLAMELRERDKKSAKTSMTEKQLEASARMPLYPGENQPVEKASDTKAKDNNPEKRITFRLDDNLYEQIQHRCQEIGIDYSALIRRAIIKHLEGESAAKGIADMGMPAEALALIGPFQVWGSDIREELRLRFLKLLAMSYVASGKWRRVEWIHRIHAGLLQLYRCLESKNVGRNSI
jgi:hypothetical protein